MFSRVWTPPEKYTRTITRISNHRGIRARSASFFHRDIARNAFKRYPLPFPLATSRPASTRICSNTLAKPGPMERASAWTFIWICNHLRNPSPPPSLEWNSSQELLEWDATPHFPPPPPPSSSPIFDRSKSVARSIKQIFSACLLSRFVCLEKLLKK